MTIAVVVSFKLGGKVHNSVVDTSPSALLASALRTKTYETKLIEQNQVDSFIDMKTKAGFSCVTFRPDQYFSITQKREQENV